MGRRRGRVAGIGRKSEKKKERKSEKRDSNVIEEIKLKTLRGKNKLKRFEMAVQKDTESKRVMRSVLKPQMPLLLQSSWKDHI